MTITDFSHSFYMRDATPENIDAFVAEMDSRGYARGNSENFGHYHINRLARDTYIFRTESTSLFDMACNMIVEG